MVDSKTIALGIIKAVGILILLALLFYFTYQIRMVFSYLMIALLFTLVANPIVEFLKFKLKFKSIPAIIVTLLIFIILLGGLVMLFVPLILSQSDNFSLMNAKAIETNINELITLVHNFLKKYHIDSSVILSQQKWFNQLNLALVTNFFNSILSILSNMGVGVVSVFFITFFFLKDKEAFLGAVADLLPEKHKKKILHSSLQIYNLLSRYFTGLLIQLSIIFVLYLIVLLILGMDNAIIIAFLCAVLNIIPYLGPIISTVFAVFLTMMNHIQGDFQSEILPSALYTLIGFLAVQFIDNNFSAPIIFSKSVKSHPLEIFLVIVTGGFLLGIFGMIIAVPSYTVIKVIFKEFFPNNPIIKILTKNI